MKRKRLIKQVLWSGGLDSTYLIQKLLAENNRVEAFYVEIKNNIEKTERETAAIEKVLPFFKGKDFSFKRLVSIEMFDKSVKLQRAQLPFFLFAAIHLPGPVLLGSVKDDNTADQIPDVHAVVHALNRFREIPLVLEFPLLSLSKAEIYERIDPFVRERITFCQNHGDDLCGLCKPCRMMRAAVPNSIYFSGAGLPRLTTQGVRR
jgi:7-cyano-7-deazaguanine synthase in queuosine biosynthesis